MNQSDQNTPAQQELVMQGSEQVAATPRLGLAKGMIAMLIGFMSFGGLFLIALFVGFAATVEPWYGISGGTVAMITVAFLLPPISFGLCLWRGIVAIRKRRVRRVTPLNFGLWLGLFVVVCIPGVIAAELISPILQIYLLWFLSQWWLWVIVAVAVGIGIWLKRRKAQSQENIISRKSIDEPDQNVPAQEERAIRDSEPIAATPGLGLAKGIVAILLGVVAGVEIAFIGLLGNAVLLAMTNNPWYDYHGREAWTNYSVLITGGVIGSIIFGLCLWRGIVAIRKRRVIRVTHFSFGLWLIFFIVACIPVVFVASQLPDHHSPSAFRPQWWVWVTLAVVVVAVGIGIWSDRRRAKSKESIISNKRLLRITGACIVAIITVAVVFTHLPKPQYDLSIDSTEGGSIATTREGTFTHDKGTLVILVARADAGYRFAGWSGDVGNVSNVNSVVTAVTIDDSYHITANFEPGYAPMVAAGTDLTVGLKADGTVVAVGWNAYGQCDVGDWTDIVQVAARSHTVGLKSDGTAVAVGSNDHGQCNVGDWTGIVQVATGGWHTVGLKSDGTVVAVGYGYGGRCDVEGWTDIVQVAAGRYHTVGLKSDGTVVAVGSYSSGQCNVGGWTGIIQVAAGYAHTVGLRSDGTVVAAGSNLYGQSNVGGWTGIIQVAAGPGQFNGYTVGLKSDGTVVAVGNNDDGQCDVGGWTDMVQVAAGQWTRWASSPPAPWSQPAPRLSWPSGT